MASATDVSNYKYMIKRELSWYGNKIATMHQQGNKPSFDKEIRLALLQAFVEIANFYLDEYTDTDNNLFTIAEFEDIQQHINRIANSFHWLDLN